MGSPGAAELLLRLNSQDVPASPVRPRRRSSAAHGLSHSASGAGRDATPTGIYSSPVSGSKRLRSETDTSPRANDNSPGASPSFDNVEAAAFAVAALSAVKVGALLSTPGSPLSPRRRSSGRRNNNVAQWRHSRVLRSSPRRMAALRSPLDADESGGRQDADSNADDALSDDDSFDDHDVPTSAAMMDDGDAHDAPEVASPLPYTDWSGRGAARRGAAAAAAADAAACERSPYTRRGPRRASLGGREYALPRRPPALAHRRLCAMPLVRLARPTAAGRAVAALLADGEEGGSEDEEAEEEGGVETGRDYLRLRRRSAMAAAAAAADEEGTGSARGDTKDGPTGVRRGGRRISSRSWAVPAEDATEASPPRRRRPGAAAAAGRRGGGGGETSPAPRPPKPRRSASAAAAAGAAAAAPAAAEQASDDDDDGCDADDGLLPGDGGGGDGAEGGVGGRPRVVAQRGRQMPSSVTNPLMAWFLEHAEHPYPSHGGLGVGRGVPACLSDSSPASSPPRGCSREVRAHAGDRPRRHAAAQLFYEPPQEARTNNGGGRWTLRASIPPPCPPPSSFLAQALAPARQQPARILLAGRSTAAPAAAAPWRRPCAGMEAAPPAAAGRQAGPPCGRPCPCRCPWRA